MIVLVFFFFLYNLVFVFLLFLTLILFFFFTDCASVLVPVNRGSIFYDYGNILLLEFVSSVLFVLRLAGGSGLRLKIHRGDTRFSYLILPYR